MSSSSSSILSFMSSTRLMSWSYCFEKNSSHTSCVKESSLRGIALLLPQSSWFCKNSRQKQMDSMASKTLSWWFKKASFPYFFMAASASSRIFPIEFHPPFLFISLFSQASRFVSPCLSRFSSFLT